MRRGIRIAGMVAVIGLGCSGPPADSGPTSDPPDRIASATEPRSASMTTQQKNPAASQTSEPRPKAAETLSEAELETVSGGASSGAQKKRDDTGADLMKNWAG